MADPLPPAPGVPPNSPQRGQQIARAALVATLVLLGLFTLRDFLPALAWAVVFAIVLWPLHERALRRWPRRTVLVPLLFTLAVALIFVLPVALALLQIGREAHALLEWGRNAGANGIPVPVLLRRLPFGSAAATAWWQANLGNPGQARALLAHFGHDGGLVAFSRNLGRQLVHRVTLFVFTLLTLFFLFRDGRDFAAELRRAGARAFGPSGERIAKQMIASVHGTVNGLVLVGIGEGVLFGIADALAGVPHPTLLGAFSAVAAIIPFGAPVAIGLAVLLLLGQGSTVAALILLGFGLVVAFGADHFVRPVLIGGATRLPFLWVLLGILGGLEAWGLLGLFLGPAIIAALVLLWREWTAEPVPLPV